MWDHDKSNLILAGSIQSGWQCFKSLSAKAYSTALIKKRIALFWDITQHVVVISYWCLWCIITQKSTALIYFMAEAWNHTQHSPSFMLVYQEGRILRFWLTDVLPYIIVKMYCRKQIFHILICGNKMPTRCNRGFYCSSYCLHNMFRAPPCPSSGAQEYYTVVAARGISCSGFQVAGLVWSWGLCVQFAGCCSILQTGHITFELLMMGMVAPETCCASNKNCNKNLCCI